MREPSTCKILVIDDEAALLRLMKTCLERLGYQVDASEVGSTAWQQYQMNAGKYDLVIADLTMPDLDMEPLLPRFVELNARVTVLVCSGRPFEVASLARPVRDRFRVLAKPFTPKTLAETVSAALSAPVSHCALA